jgi:lipopolysaccharide biosynthesis glycosyltransferase
MEPHLPALFWSIAQSHPTVSPLVHFICLGDDDAFPDRVTAAAARRGLSCRTYTPKTLPEARLSGLRTYKGGCKGNPASFYGRWLLPELLPTDIDRVVYLDTDVLVQSDLRDLIDLLPESHAVGAAPDMPFDSCPENVYRDYYLPHFKAMGISPRRGEMFNSGVLVLSLNRWRNDNLVDLLFQTRDRIVASGLSVRYQDQDVLNVALGGRIHPLPADWNVTPLYLPVEFWAREDLSLVHLLHFVTNPKPWDRHHWIRLPPQAAKLYLNARLRSEANAKDSQRWRTYFEWYDDLTQHCTKRLTRARARFLKELLASY